jgi:hypothetical protein
MGFFDKAQDWANNQLGLDTKVSELGASAFDSKQWEPWAGLKDTDAFFPAQRIDQERWSKVYPYRLIVIDIRTDNIVSSGGVSGSSDVETTSFQHGSDYIITQTGNSTHGWSIDLPITPQQLSITDQFAINTSATMRGIVEEHNGVKFKIINVQGTTGYWPTRPTQGAKLKSPTILGTLLGGTLSALGGLTQGINQVKSAFTGEHPNKMGRAEEPELYQTGYYQAQLLGQFFERYAQEKKKAKNKHWRLVFDIPKQNQSFIVTPINFSLSQSQQKPTEIVFNFQLKAWKRIELRRTEFEAPGNIPKLTPNIIQRVLAGIKGARQTLGAATNLVKAIRSDFRKPLDALRQTSLAVKDLGGLAYSVADLAPSIINDYKSSIKESLFIAKNSFKRGVDKGGKGINTGSATSSPAVNIKSQSLTDKAGAAIDAIVAEKGRNEGLSEQAVADGALGSDAAQAQQISGLNQVFDNPEENFELFDSIDIDELTLTPQQQNLIDDELELISLITIDDLRQNRKEIENLMLDMSNWFGAGDSTYSSIYGKPEPRDRATPMTVDENDILISLMEALQSYDLLIATKAWDDNKIASSLEYVGGLANEAGIDFENYSSKFLAPVPFGSTIEEIAAKYLGNADRYIEIATLNNLRSPYIDEDGFIYDLLSNAEGRQFTVNDSENNIYIGQTIILQSDIIPSFSRKVIDIEKISDENYLVIVDGLDDLDNLKTIDGAKLQGYLPGTINSQNQIYIPINASTQEDDRTFEIPYLDDQALTRLSKVDWLLKDNGDLAINSVGDFRLANGLTNLVQALKLKVWTKRGTLLRHLNYGLGLEHGVSVADIDNGSIFKSLNEMIKADSRFDSIERIDIRLSGATLAIDMAVKLAGQSGILPISFDVSM